jgi:galactokinase
VFKFEIEVSIRIVIADSLVKNETNTDNYKKRF